MLVQLGIESRFYRGDAKRQQQKEIEIIRGVQNKKVVCILDDVLLLIKPLNSYVRLAGYCRFLANFTYCSHPLFITVMTFLLRKFIGYDLRYSTELFVAAVISTFVCGFICLKIRELKHQRK